ncbi:MAG: putative addiction module antidote protein [Bdellovibrionales bacterium RIFOXYD1_FULL_53_11]|nr:MAG: putative addiction module antidote protein [Bdellovibrionales bacterium RIFOXYD1_FULL_53_11]
MPKRVRDYEADLIERLKDPKFTVEYLNAALEDEDEGTEERFLIALRHVAQAQGVSFIAERSGVARQAIYKSLSKDGNPELATLRSVLGAMGLKLAVEKKKKAI